MKKIYLENVENDKGSSLDYSGIRYQKIISMIVISILTTKLLLIAVCYNGNDWSGLLMVG